MQRGWRFRASSGIELEPTTLKRGEGLISGCRVCLRAKWVAKGKVVVVGRWWRMSETQP